MKLDTESKMDFDYSITTEDRFALRKWFQGFVDALNSHDLETIKVLLSGGMIAEGFADYPMQTEEFINFIQRTVMAVPNTIVRYPIIKFKFQGYLFHLTGNLEIYTDGVMSHEGSIDIEVVKNDETFQMVRQKFYPRLMVTVDDHNL